MDNGRAGYANRSDLSDAHTRAAASRPGWASRDGGGWSFQSLACQRPQPAFPGSRRAGRRIVRTAPSARRGVWRCSRSRRPLHLRLMGGARRRRARPGAARHRCVGSRSTVPERGLRRGPTSRGAPRSRGESDHPARQGVERRRRWVRVAAEVVADVPRRRTMVRVRSRRCRGGSRARRQSSECSNNATSIACRVDADTVSALLAVAGRHIDSATAVLAIDLEGAYALAYDAARRVRPCSSCIRDSVPRAAEATLPSLMRCEHSFPTCPVFDRWICSDGDATRRSIPIPAVSTPSDRMKSWRRSLPRAKRLTRPSD